MIRRAPQFLALTILLPVTICGSIARAQEMFKLIGEKEIRARLLANILPIASIHGKSYLLRPDGVLLSDS